MTDSLETSEREAIDPVRLPGFQDCCFDGQQEDHVAEVTSSGDTIRINRRLPIGTKLYTHRDGLQAEIDRLKLDLERLTRGTRACEFVRLSMVNSGLRAALAEAKKADPLTEEQIFQLWPRGPFVDRTEAKTFGRAIIDEFCRINGIAQP